MIFQITTLFVTDIGFDYIAPNPTGDDLTSFFETVVLLSKGEIDSKKVRVEKLNIISLPDRKSASSGIRNCDRRKRLFWCVPDA